MADQNENNTVELQDKTPSKGKKKKEKGKDKITTVTPRTAEEERKKFAPTKSDFFSHLDKNDERDARNNNNNNEQKEEEFEKFDKKVLPQLDEDEFQKLLSRASESHPLPSNVKPVAPEVLNQLIESLQHEVFITSRLKMLSEWFQQNYYTAEQVEIIIRDFPYYEMKNEALIQAFPNTLDKDDFRELLLNHVFSDLERKVIVEKCEHNLAKHV